MAKKKMAVKAARAKTLVDELNSLPIHGWVVSFGSKSGTKHKHADVVNALTAAGLDPSEAKKFLPAQAFARACRQLQEERVIDVLRSDKDEIVFQFSKRQVATDAEEGGDLYEYKKEARIKLDKSTGAITCKIPKLQEQAQKELDRCMEERTTSDITKITIGLFDKNADLMALPGAIGVYVVLKEYTSFVDQIKIFLERLGRRPYMLPIPAGVSSGDRTIQDTVEEHLNGLLEQHKQAIAAFSLCTRPDTIKSAAEKIVETRVKIEAYATYLGDALVTKLLAGVEEGKKELVSKVNQLDEERKNAPQGIDGKDRFGCKLGGQPAQINAVMTDELQTVEEISKACAFSETRVLQHLKFWAERGCFECVSGKWRIKPDAGSVQVVEGNGEKGSGEPF